MLKKIKTFILSHKIIVIIVVILIAVGVYFVIKTTNKKEVSYITNIVQRGNITTVVTGTGQVEASSTITLKTGTSGDITYIGVKAGDTVKKGALIASVDSFDAKMALENAKISLAKLKSSNSLDLLKEENSLKESYDSGWNKVSAYVTDTTELLDNMEDIYGNDGYLGYKNIYSVANTGREKVSDAEDSFYDAKNSLEDLVKIYKTLSRSDSNEKIKSLINKAYESSLLVAVASKDTETAFNYIAESIDDETNNTTVSSNRSDVSSWLNTSNDYVNSLLSVYNGIDESEESLSETKNGGDVLDIRSAELSVQSKLNAYNDCFAYAPFDGVIATLTAKIGESSGSSIGTIITNQKVVTVSLNEVDIASIKLGQKASLTFDAINDLTISGDVVEIDSVGTVSSGVVTYDVKIAFNEDDERVKAGMSANVEIVTASKQNILTVLSSAIKTKNGNSYVEILGENGSYVKKNITIGISNDTITEIISGLNEGDKVITKTVSGTSNSSSSSSSSNKNGINGGMGGGPMGGSAMGSIMH